MSAYSFRDLNPTNHLINGGFDFAATPVGWTSDSDVTVTVSSGKLNLNASVANKGVYQELVNLEPNGVYFLSCAVNAGGNSAKVYTVNVPAADA